MRHLFPIYNTTKSYIPASNRYNRWGNNRYRGNSDGRLFADLVLRYNAKSVADPMIGSGTTKDCIRDLNAEGADIRYWGGDLKEGFDLTEDDIPGKYDFVWIHPPYWNMIRYSGNDADLSNAPTYEAFLEKLTTCLERCYDSLNEGGRLAVLVSDLQRYGTFYPITRDIQNLAGKIGSLRAVIVKEMGNCWSDINPASSSKRPPMDGITIRHESCMIFKK